MFAGSLLCPGGGRGRGAGTAFLTAALRGPQNRILLLWCSYCCHLTHPLENPVRWTLLSPLTDQDTEALTGKMIPLQSKSQKGRNLDADLSLSDPEVPRRWPLGQGQSRDCPWEERPREIEVEASGDTAREGDGGRETAEADRGGRTERFPAGRSQGDTQRGQRAEGRPGQGQPGGRLRAGAVPAGTLPPAALAGPCLRRGAPHARRPP